MLQRVDIMYFYDNFTHDDLLNFVEKVISALFNS